MLPFTLLGCIRCDKIGWLKKIPTLRGPRVILTSRDLKWLRTTFPTCSGQWLALSHLCWAPLIFPLWRLWPSRDDCIKWALFEQAQESPAANNHHHSEEVKRPQGWFEWHDFQHHQNRSIPVAVRIFLTHHISWHFQWNHRKAIKKNQHLECFWCVPITLSPYANFLTASECMNWLDHEMDGIRSINPPAIRKQTETKYGFEIEKSSPVKSWGFSGGYLHGAAPPLWVRWPVLRSGPRRCQDPQSQFKKNNFVSGPRQQAEQSHHVFMSHRLLFFCFFLSIQDWITHQ